jgi:ABC-2 type transport system ATP-binding protein
MINFDNVNLYYKDTNALKNINIELPEAGICGLLGRNGAGKTTLLSLISAYRQPTSGKITIQGQNVYENPEILPQIAYIYDNQKEVEGEYKVKDLIHISAVLRPNWDGELANRLLELFQVPTKKSMSALSHGQRAAVHVTIGLAGQTPITLYDEAYIGMDAAMRKIFIRELLEDYMQRPKLIIFSTHYINEMDKIFSDALILHEGQVLAYDDCDTLRQKGAVITGDSEAVDRFIINRKVLSQRSLGNQKEAVLFCELTKQEHQTAAIAGLTISQPSLQDLFIYLTGKEGEQE